MTTIQIHPIAYVFTDDRELLDFAEEYSVTNSPYCVNIEAAMEDIENLKADEVRPEETKLLNTLKKCVALGCSGDAMFFAE